MAGRWSCSSSSPQKPLSSARRSKRAAPLLSYPEEDHPLLPRMPPSQRARHLILALATLKANHGDLLASDEPLDLRVKTLSELTKKCRRSHWVAQVLAEEKHQLTRGLQLRHIAVDVDPIHATDLKADMICENLTDGRTHGNLLFLVGVETPSCPTVALASSLSSV